MARLGSLLPALLLLLGCLLLGRSGAQDDAALSRPIRSLPAVLAGLSGEDREISQEERLVAGMTDYLFREFSRDSALAFSVYVGYYDSQRQGRTIHSPKNCLPGSGWQALAAAKDTLVVGDEPVSVNRYVLANGSRRALVYYWYQGRGRIVASEYRVKWNLVRDAARYGRTEEALVRIVVPIGGAGAATDGDGEALAIATAREVAAELIPEMWHILPATPAS